MSISYDMEYANVDIYHVVATQIQEMELIRSKVFQLEQTHVQMKQKYVPRFDPQEYNHTDLSQV